MPACTRSAVTMLKIFCCRRREATARRTGFVQRMSKMTGTLFLALVTLGAWREAKTTLAPLAAKATQLCQPVDAPPKPCIDHEHESHGLSAGHALSDPGNTLHSLDHMCDDSLSPAFTKGYKLAALDLNCPKNSTRRFLALEGVRRKQVPDSSRIGR